MLYFAELKGRPVFTNGDKKPIGKLDDLVFRATSQPIITKLVIKTPLGTKIISTFYLKHLSPTISLQKEFAETSLGENELYIHKNVIDQQILDLKGNKMVRVNDVALQDKPLLTIEGVDIGLIGILRWLPGQKMAGDLCRSLGYTPVSTFLSWADIQPMELARGKVILKKEEKKLKRLLPEDLADHLERISIKNISRFVDIMDEDLAAEVIANLNVPYQQGLFKNMLPDHAARILERIDPDEAVDILLTVSEKKRELIMAEFSFHKKQELEALLSVPQTPIGELLNPEFFVARPDEIATKVKARIKKETEPFSSLRYVYVVKEKQLIGVVSLYELLMAESELPLMKFMISSVVVLHLSTPIDIAIKRMLKYKLEALPVINDKKEILGIVTFDDVAEQIIKKI
jgi:magnesium transporter